MIDSFNICFQIYISLLQFQTKKMIIKIVPLISILILSINCLTYTPNYGTADIHLITTINVKSSYQVDVYIISKKNIYNIYIEKLTVTNSTLTNNITNTLTLSQTLNKPTVQFYKSMFAIQESNLRALIYMDNLTLFTQHVPNMKLNGVYSQRNDIFYLEKQPLNSASILQYNLESSNPRSMNIYSYNISQIQHLLFWGQTKLITFLRGTNYIHIRDTHQHNIPQNFGDFQTIILPQSDYQCYCLDPSQNYLYILDINGFLLKIDLRNNSIIKQSQINIYQQKQMFSDSQLITFYRYTYHNNNKKSGFYRSIFNQSAQSFLQLQSFSSNANLLRDSKNRFFILQNFELPYSIDIQPLNNDSCFRYGVYQHLGVCLFCPEYCQNCTNQNTCIVCLTGYTLNSSTFLCEGQPKCSSKKFFSVQSFSCVNCSNNCKTCTGLDNCLSCDLGYSLEVGSCRTNNNQNNYSSNGAVSENKLIGQIGLNLSVSIQELFNNSNSRLINTIPLNRQIFKFLMLFFPNIDDFWLYSYHQRNFTSSFNRFLDIISMLENQKWNPLQSLDINQITELTSQVNKFQQYFDTRKAYSKSKFIQREQKGQTLLANCLYFFTINIICSFVMLALLKGVFYLLSNYRISKFLRPFSFWGYFGVLLVDGNIQIIYFLMFSQSQLLFSLQFNDKIIQSIQLFLFFLYLWLSVSCYMLYYSFYKKLSTYFVDNTLATKHGILGLTINSAFRQLCLAAVHNFMRYNPSLQNLMLIVVQGLYIGFNIGFSSMRLKFKESFIVWISLLFSFLRIVFNFILYLQFESLKEGYMIQQFNTIIQLNLFSYIAIYFLSTLLYILINIVRSIKKLIKRYICRKIFKTEDKPSLEPSSHKLNHKTMHSYRRKCLKNNNNTKEFKGINDSPDKKYNKSLENKKNMKDKTFNEYNVSKFKLKQKNQFKQMEDSFQNQKISQVIQKKSPFKTHSNYIVKTNHDNSNKKAKLLQVKKLDTQQDFLQQQKLRTRQNNIFDYQQNFTFRPKISNNHQIQKFEKAVSRKHDLVESNFDYSKHLCQNPYENHIIQLKKQGRQKLIKTKTQFQLTSTAALNNIKIKKPRDISKNTKNLIIKLNQTQKVERKDQ